MAYKQEQAKSIHLYGVEEVLNNVAREIQELNTTIYNNSKINIDIN
jgi:hypothetical protein